MPFARFHPLHLLYLAVMVIIGLSGCDSEASSFQTQTAVTLLTSDISPSPTVTARPTSTPDEFAFTATALALLAAGTDIADLQLPPTTADPREPDFFATATTLALQAAGTDIAPGEPDFFATATTLALLAEQQIRPTPASILFSFTIFRDPESLTIYIEDGQRADFSDIRLGADYDLRRLDSFPAFDGLPFDNLPTPICLRLERVGTTQPIPLNCSPDNTITERLGSADIFWSIDNQDRIIVIWRGDIAVDFCPTGQSRCEITVSAE